jgi:hypothetical protein
MSAPPAPDRSGVVAQRLAEAALIESEWNAMSYKDRASWWMSAKWYGYQSAEAYRRGDDAQPNESCRYGEPGFFIATRVAYFEAQAAVAEVVAATTPAPVSESVATPEVETTYAAPTATPATPTTPPTESVTEPVAEPLAVAAREAAAATATTTTTQQSNTNNHHKKKKKNKRGASAGAGKTIEISVGR